MVKIQGEWEGMFSPPHPSMTGGGGSRGEGVFAGLGMIVQQNVLLNTNTGTWKIHCVLQSESGSDEIVE